MPVENPTDSDGSVLDRFSGVTIPREWTNEDTGRAWVKNSTKNLANAVLTSLSVEEAAAILGISPSASATG